MASYVLDEFLGAGALKVMGQKFAEDGWDDVPTLKVIDAEDMEALELTDAQRVSGATARVLHTHNQFWVFSVNVVEARKPYSFFAEF
jgi:hypothetical protein